MAAILAIVEAAVPQPEDGAGGSCVDWALDQATASLTATCTRTDGVTKKTAQISIGECVANIDGDLGCRPG